MTRINLFNQALLAKQCWNLLTSSNTLIAKLLKALYHPHNHIVDAKIVRRSSPYWRRILWGRELLKEEIGWRVGDGSQISLRQDNWISGFSRFKLYQPDQIPNHIVKFVDLIDRSSQNWDKKFLSRTTLLLIATEFYKFLFPPYTEQIKESRCHLEMVNLVSIELTGLHIIRILCAKIYLILPTLQIRFFGNKSRKTMCFLNSVIGVG